MARAYITSRVLALENIIAYLSIIVLNDMWYTQDIDGRLSYSFPVRCRVTSVCSEADEKLIKSALPARQEKS